MQYEANHNIFRFIFIAECIQFNNEFVHCSLY